MSNISKGYKMKRLFLILLILSGIMMAPGICGAACPGATCYFAPAAVGSGDCSSAGNACTLTTAFTTATTSDSILGINGTSTTTSNWNWPNLAGVTLGCVNDYQCVLQAAAGATTRVLHTNYAATIGKVTIDGNNIAQSCITTNSGSDVSGLTLHGTAFLNPTQNWVYGTHLQNFTLDGTWTAQSNSAAAFYGFNFTSAAAGNGTYAINGGTVTQTGAGAVTNNAFTFAPVASGLTVDISGNTTYTKTAANTAAVLRGISATGVTTLKIANQTCTFTGATAANNASTCIAANNATITSTATIHDVSADMGSTSNQGGIVVMIGDNDDTTPAHPNSITGEVYNVTGSNSNHGILFGWVTDGKSHNNKMINTLLNTSGKGTTRLLSYNNLMIGVPTLGAMVSKNGTNDQHYNNTWIATGNGGVCERATNSTAGTVPSTGIIFKNNICQMGSYTGQFVQVDTDGGGGASTATFSNNLYWTTNTPTSYWVYQTNSYSTAATWGAAHETVYTWGDPQLSTTTYLPVMVSGVLPPTNNGTCLTTSTVCDYAGKTYQGYGLGQTYLPTEYRGF